MTKDESSSDGEKASSKSGRNLQTRDGGVLKFWTDLKDQVISPNYPKYKVVKNRPR